jgi:beta-lactam-binding protein with PASTA domain
VVPDLVGMSVSDARTAWRAAGFTGPFSPAFGQNNKTVLTQSQASGACLAPAATISVTY